MAPHDATLSGFALWPRLRPWIALQELPKHLANLLPFLFGTVLAYWHSGSLDWNVLGVSLAALFFLTDGTYIANEYFDYEADRENLTRIGGDSRVGVTTTGGTRVLVKGLIPRKHALVAAAMSFVIAIPLGLWLQFGLGTGPLTIWLGVLGVFIGWFYSAPPIKASYRGLGELFIAVGQGLVIFGGFYVQHGFDAIALTASLPWFFALPAMKIIREFPDFTADAKFGKRGLTHILGRDLAARVYAILIIVAILAFIPVYAIIRSPLFVLALVPIALIGRSAVMMLRDEWKRPDRLEIAAANGFSGMLLIPVVLTLVFLVEALVRTG